MKFKLLKTALAGLILSVSVFANAGLVTGTVYEYVDDIYLGSGQDRDLVFDINSYLDSSFDLDLTSASIYFSFGDDDSYDIITQTPAGTDFTYSHDDCFLGCNEVYYSDTHGTQLLSNQDVEQAQITIGSDVETVDGYYLDNIGTRYELSHQVEIPRPPCTSFFCGWATYKKYYKAYEFTRDANFISGLEIDLSVAALIDLESDGLISTNVMATLSDFNYHSAQLRFAGVESVKLESNEVPEPSTLAIFALGMIGLASRRFKKQS